MCQRAGLDTGSLGLVLLLFTATGEIRRSAAPMSWWS
jgi:hypothetical protein